MKENSSGILNAAMWLAPNRQIPRILGDGFRRWSLIVRSAHADPKPVFDLRD
jgi:hypothetical protein